jgi:hypothetical protein
VADREQARGAALGIAELLVGPLDVALLAGTRDDRIDVAAHRRSPIAPLEQRADALAIPHGQEGLEPVLALDLVESIPGHPLEVGVGVLDRALTVEQKDHDWSGLEDSLGELGATDFRLAGAATSAVPHARVFDHCSTLFSQRYLPWRARRVERLAQAPEVRPETSRIGTSR